MKRKIQNIIINKKREISPLIAVVLIIGFTVALAVIIINWGTGVIEEQEQEESTLFTIQDFDNDKLISLFPEGDVIFHDSSWILIDPLFDINGSIKELSQKKNLLLAELNMLNDQLYAKENNLTYECYESGNNGIVQCLTYDSSVYEFPPTSLVIQ